MLNAYSDGPHELRTDVKIVRYPERYSDPRGAEIWEHVLELLATVQKRREEA